MITIAISLVTGLITMSVFGLLFSFPAFKPLWGLLPGIIAAIATYYYVVKKMFAEFQTMMEEVQKMLTPKNPRRPTPPPIDRAIKKLKTGYKWDKKIPFAKKTIDSQIGQLLFMGNRKEEALPYLENSFYKNWIAITMHAVILFRERNHEKMHEVFEYAVSHNKGESLLWNVWAWCTHRAKDRDKAISILNRGKKAVPSDERTQKNLTSLQNGKKMNMKGWNEMWYQFGLEPMPQQLIQQMYGPNARPR